MPAAILFLMADPMRQLDVVGPPTASGQGKATLETIQPPPSSSPLDQRRALLRAAQSPSTLPALPAPPEPLPAVLSRVKRLQALKARVEALPKTAPAGQPLHPRTADLLASKGRVLVTPPKPHKPILGLATIKDRAALGGRMRGSKTCKTPKARARLLSAIGRKGGIAKAQKRRAMLKALGKLDRQIARDKRRLLKAGVPLEMLD